MAFPLMIIGTTLQVLSALKQSQLASASSKFQAEMARQQAEANRIAGEIEAKRLQREKERMLARQRALYGKAGVWIGEGSPLEVMADTATQYEQDIAIARYNSELARRRAISEANYYGAMAKEEKIGGYLGAGATLLTSAGQMRGLKK